MYVYVHVYGSVCMCMRMRACMCKCMRACMCKVEVNS